MLATDRRPTPTRPTGRTFDYSCNYFPRPRVTRPRTDAPSMVMAIAAIALRPVASREAASSAA